MKFAVVNGRAPRPQSFCALCCKAIGGSHTWRLGNTPLIRAKAGIQV
jgi:hypothetical protein